MQHFSITAGSSLVAIEEREIERFGKRVLLTPPDLAKETAEKEEAAKPDEKPEEN